MFDKCYSTPEFNNYEAYKSSQKNGGNEFYFAPLDNKDSLTGGLFTGIIESVIKRFAVKSEAPF